MALFYFGLIFAVLNLFEPEVKLCEKSQLVGFLEWLAAEQWEELWSCVC